MARSIRLNVYYLTPYRSLHTLLNIVTLGLFTPYHSAIEIDGIEYAFYGHPFQFSGVMTSEPNRMSMIRAHSRIYGQTSLSNIDIDVKAHSLNFNGSNYDILNFNCNTFADRFLYLLTRHRLPSWINRSERCLQRLQCFGRWFHCNAADINIRIISALYLRSAGDQQTVFNLLGLSMFSIDDIESISACVILSRQ
jgi:hypothetical protein